jgi:cell division protein FtsQ
MTSRYTTHLRPRPEVNTSVDAPLDVRLMHTAASFMFVAVFVGVLFAGAWALVRLPAFALTGITVLGEVDHNNAVTLRANVTSKLTGNFFTIDLDRVRRTFESVPWVRLATVQREFPNRLRVTLQEHQPVAYWGDDNDARLVNTYGEVFEANVGDLDDDKLPRLSGPDSQSEQVLAMYLALAPLFKNMTLAFDRLELTGRGSWRAHVGRGAVIELGRGNTQEVMARLQVMTQTLAQVTQKLGRKVSAIEFADLRHENGYALRLRGVSTQAVLASRERIGR